MRILSLSNSDTAGGAARASFRIFEALTESGTDVRMLVKYKNSANERVLSTQEFARSGMAGRVDNLKTRIENKYYKNRLSRYEVNPDFFISNLSSISLKKALKILEFDILHLHWISHQFLNLEELVGLDKPIVWTLHDCWAFTSICHYFDSCDRYRVKCGSCPILNSTNERDLSNEIWLKKNRVYNQSSIHVVTPSRWLGQCAANSSLMGRFPVSVIPYPLDSEKFRIVDKGAALKRLGLPGTRKYILFGAMNALHDFRKGFHFIEKALKLFPPQEKDNIELLVFGSPASGQEDIHGFRINFLGTINDDTRLVDAYNVADVVVTPSMSENLSLLIMEAMACGTPVVGFDIGGNSDLIEHKENGYLARPYLVEDLAAGVQWCLEHTTSHALGVNARHKIQNTFSESLIAQKYLHLFDSLL